MKTNINEMSDIVAAAFVAFGIFEKLTATKKQNVTAEEMEYACGELREALRVAGVDPKKLGWY